MMVVARVELDCVVAQKELVGFWSYIYVLMRQCARSAGQKALGKRTACDAAQRRQRRQHDVAAHAACY